MMNKIILSSAIKSVSLALLFCTITACGSNSSSNDDTTDATPPTTDSGSDSDANSNSDSDTDSNSDSDSGSNSEEESGIQLSDLSHLSLTEQAESRLDELDVLMQQANELQLDITREQTTVWFANEFLKYADWDEANPDQVAKFFENYYPMRNEGEAYSNLLPDFERQQVINILEYSIKQLMQVVGGTIIRPAVNKVDWHNIIVDEDTFLSNDKPIFLYDYFSKSMGNPVTDEQIYNDHLGNVDHVPSVSLHWMNGEDSYAPWQISKMQAHPSTKVGYSLLWNRGIPQWVRTKEPNITQGRSLFTEYDIDNPTAIDLWTKIVRELARLTEDHKGTQMGIILANEPHWFSEQGHWTQNYGEMTTISTHTRSKFNLWLAQTYNYNITLLNQNWQTQFASFDDVSFEFPLATSLRGEPLWYDWCRFNMDRAIEWFTRLQDNIHEVNPDADTHIKIMPDLFTENNRSHGIDLEALTQLTTMIGDDAKTRRRDLRSTSPEHWESYYSYFWEELAVSYDFMESIAPNKIHVNSETHFLSSSWWRELDTPKEYIRSSIWLATVLGMDAGLHWFWARDPDGSPEQRLEGDLNFYDPALAGSYAASTGMQPQVANEVTQVTMDLNSVSEQIMAIREQRRPIRLFYSETSAINKTQHMTEQFEPFEALFFEGFPMGYATKNVLTQQSHEDWDLVLVYKTEFVTDSEFAALQAYLDGGGTVLIDSPSSLSKNEYGVSRTASLNESNGDLVTLTTDATVADITAQALTLATSTTNGIRIEEQNGLDQKTTMWRTVTKDNKHLVTLMNLGKNQSELSLSINESSNVKVTDLLTGANLTASFTLEAQGVMMLEVEAL